MAFFSSFFVTNEKLKSNQSIRCEKHKFTLKQITYSISALHVWSKRYNEHVLLVQAYERWTQSSYLDAKRLFHFSISSSLSSFLIPPNQRRNETCSSCLFLFNTDLLFLLEGEYCLNSTTNLSATELNIATMNFIFDPSKRINNF